MADTTSLLGAAVLGAAVLGSTGDMPNYNTDRFTWEGHCWELVSDPDLSTALVKDGGDTVAQEQFAARLANILRLNVGNLYVTETATIDTAVIARLFVDLFTAHKIGADELAANSVTAEKIVASQELSAKVGNFLEINAEQITGGSFTGETFEGGTFTGGLFKTSDALPGQVEIADDAFNSAANNLGARPGIRIIPEDPSGLAKLPGIGPGTNGVTISGGKPTAGGGTIIQANPAEAFLRTFQTNGQVGGEMQTSSTSSYMRTYRSDGTTGGEFWTTNTESTIRTFSGNGSESGWVYVTPTAAELAFVNSSNNYGSQIRTEQSTAFIATSSGTGTRRIEVTSDATRLYTADSSSNRSYVEATNSGIKIRRVNSASQVSCAVDVANREVDMYSVTSSNTYAGRVRANTGGVFITGIRSVASSVNARISTDSGEVVTISSSRRYKENIENWEPDTETVLALQPRRWTPKAGYGEGDIGAIPAGGRYVGFVAEEVEELGLLELVDYSKDEDGNLRPESVNYDRFAAAQQVVLVDHETRIAELEARVKELTNAG